MFTSLPANQNYTTVLTAPPQLSKMAALGLLMVLCAVFLQQTSVHCVSFLVYNNSEDLNTTTVIQDDKIVLQDDAYKIQVENETLPFLNESFVEIHALLAKLELKRCRIKVIEPRAFFVDNNTLILDEIYITGNEISNIQQGVFNDVPVRTLNLSENKISTIENGAFSNNTYLQRIDLSNNELALLDPLWFDNCVNLHDISANRNKILTINPTPLLNFIKNTSVAIRLSTNLIRDFDPVLLEYFDDIEVLDISNNFLREIQEDLFENRTLKYLDIENNNLTCLPDGILHSNVTVLNVMKNMFLRCDCLKKLSEWGRDAGVLVYFPSIICEERERDVMVVYNSNVTSVVPIPKPEFFGIPNGS